MVISIVRNLYQTDTAKRMHDFFVHVLVDQSFKFANKLSSQQKCNILLFGFVFTEHLCDAGYLGYTHGHLHNRVKGHKQQSSAIAKHYKNVHRTIPQGLLKRFEVLKKLMQKQIRLLSVQNALYKSFKAKSQHAIRLDSCESIFIIFALFYVNSSHQNCFKSCNLHDLIYIFLDNGVMTTPKHRILSLVFIIYVLGNLF